MLQGANLADATRSALAMPWSHRHEEQMSRYAERLARTPRLRPGVRQGLDAARSLGVPVGVLTEGGLASCLRNLDVHGLLAHMDDVESRRKGEEAYRALAAKFRGSRLVMVGDQPDRDIGPARAAGFLAVLYSGGFTPFWNGRPAQPHHTIGSYDQIADHLDPTSGALRAAV